MKNFILFLSLVFAANFCIAQKYSTKTGKIHFEANVPLFDDVDATNTSTVAVMNTTTGDIASIAIVKNFKFKNRLMEEHFNENYVESDKYSKATFKGKIANFNKENLSSVPQEFALSGTLNFHGVTNPVTTIARIYSKNDHIIISGTFIVKPMDYNVKIPSVVKKKIAEQVNVEYYFEMIKQ